MASIVGVELTKELKITGNVIYRGRAEQRQACHKSGQHVKRNVNKIRLMSQ